MTTLVMVVIFMAAALLWNWQIMIMIQKDLQNQADLTAIAMANLAVKELPTGLMSVTNNGSTYYRVTETPSTYQAVRNNIGTNSDNSLAGFTNLQPQLRSGITGTVTCSYTTHNSDGEESVVQWTDDSASPMDLPIYIQVSYTKSKRLVVGENIVNSSNNGKITPSGKANYEVVTRVKISGTGTGNTFQYAIGMVP